MAGNVGIGFIEDYDWKDRYLVFVRGTQRYSQKLCSFLRSDMSFPSTRRRKDGSAVGNGHKRSVLVRVVQAVERPKIVVSSSVRLHLSNDLLNVLPHSTHLFVVSSLFVRGGWDRFTDRKNCLGGDIFRSRNKLTRQIIKRTSEVADGIADGQSKRWRKIFGALHVQDGFALVRVVFHGELIGLCVMEENAETPLRFIDVLLGPLNL